MTYEEVLNMVGGDYGKLIDLLYGVAELTEENETINNIVDKLDKIDNEYLVEKFRNENADIIRKPIYFVEVGVLLNKNDGEFDSYQIRGFHEEFGFYDENRCAYFKLEDAIRYGEEYVKDGVNGTYAVIQECKIDTDDLSDRALLDILNSAYYEDIPNPSEDCVIEFMYKKDDGSICSTYRDDAHNN